VRRVPTPPELLAKAARQAKKKLSMPVLVAFVLVVSLAALVVWRVVVAVRAGR
jgi:hypothetical protein